jgi:hypothetical protein
MLSTDMYLWRLLCRIARRCRLRDHTYQPQRVSELESDGHWVLHVVLCILEESQHLEMLPVVVHTIVRGFLSWMNLFETVLETFEIVSKGFELWFLHVTV